MSSLSPTSDITTGTPQVTQPAIEWVGGPDGRLRLIDQTLLPTQLQTIDCSHVKTVWEAIKMLRVRGAPAIGIAAVDKMTQGIGDRHHGRTLSKPSTLTRAPEAD